MYNGSHHMDRTRGVTTRPGGPASDLLTASDEVHPPLLRSHRVLVVEDNVAHARLARLWLEEDGHGRYDAIVVDRLSAALERLAREAFDVVLLDLSLPDSDRLETYRRARAQAPLVPIVVMTGIGDERLALQAVEEGAQDYLVKGDIEGPQLVRALDYAVVRKHADDAERQMLEAQRLEGLAVLAGGVAHQLNNLLVVIMGNASLATVDLDEHHPARTCLREIEIASERAARLARQMLAYSGRGGFVVRALDLNDVVRTTCEALERELPFEVTVRIEASPSKLPITADESQVAQLVLGLVTNAVEATTARPGIVVVRTSLHQATADEVSHGLARWELPPGPCARVEVIDTGSGMTAAVLARVFEPFYTTRLTGRGLGLPAALGIVRGHKGVLTIESVHGAGTHVSVLLPLRADP